MAWSAGLRLSTEQLSVLDLTPFRSYAGAARCWMHDILLDHPRDLFHGIPPAPQRPNPSTWRADTITAAWLGHATVLLNFFGTWILTDPVLQPRIGVALAGLTMGPRRLVAPGLRVEELPSPDLLLVSHAHMDHLDLGTLQRLPEATPTITSHDVRDLLARFGTVQELRWGEKTRLGAITVEGTPAKHWGARSITDTWRGYGGFLLEREGKTILFVGDTARTEVFREFHRRGGVDLAIMPIGAYDPWIDNHASPEEAWAMTEEMGARYVMPVHHSTFRLSREPADEPIRRFLAAAGNQRGRVVLTEVGATWELGAG
jgi:L-ascorbate metabolism protein UlaG (beta-lactamase superfamily)